MFKGSICAIVTPFKNGKVDEGKLRELIEFQIANGTDGIVPCGTTGESATLTYQEHHQIIDFTIRVVDRRIPVIAGTGSNSTAESIALTQYAKAAGADGALLITPYYNRPTQKGLVAHFRAVAEAVQIPMVIYNVPARTGVNMLPETVAELKDIPHIVAVKEASGSLQQITELVTLCGDRISVLSGDDFIVMPILSVGGKGVISVVANVAPALMASLVDAFEAGEFARASQIQREIFPLCQAMFLETNPIPVKTALALMGKMDGELRLPLVAMGEGNLKKLKEILAKYRLI
ncbi:MAG: 4-hydroxy-tetrahydrodipicolinate synthase [candidate division NC10 bacterium]|nr:4-hydroxy-tetrahydrodipicolinate synthase [candidate division NC10 bacterium]